MDQFIIDHLDAWIAREFGGLAIDEDKMPNRDAMLALVAADPDRRRRAARLDRPLS